MNTDEMEQELGVMQLSDSFFPTGIFATSNGLEFLFSKKRIKGVKDLIELISVCITRQLGPSDCTALADVFYSAKNCDLDRVIQADNAVFATKPVKEIRDASVRSGVQLIKCVAEFVGNDEILNQYRDCILSGRAHGVFPVAFAICCNALKIGKEKSMMMMLYGFTVSVTGAALRLGIMNHLEGQRVIHKIKPIIAQTVIEYSDKSLFEMWQFAPQMDVIQMSHEKMDSKMFIT